MRRHHLVELLEELGLDLHVFDDRLDDQIAAFQIGDVGRRLDASEGRVAIGLRQFAFLDELIERLGDRCNAAIQRFLCNFHEDDVEVGGGARLRDAVPHQPGAADADGADFSHE